MMSTMEIKSNKKEGIKTLLNLFFIPVIIGGLFLTLFFILLSISNNMNDRFITPYQNSVTKQDSDLYIVSTYYANDETSVKFLQTLNELEDEYNINYYLINASDYPDILEAWEIKYWPTYFVFERTDENSDAKLLYKSYGDKEVVALAKEISNVRKYGMPTNNIGATITIYDDNNSKESEITLVSVKPESNENLTTFTVEFYIENLTNQKLTINYSDFTVSSNSWNNNQSTNSTNSNTNDTIEIASGEKETILITYNGSNQYNQINITYNRNGVSNTKYKWAYKMWPTE